MTLQFERTRQLIGDEAMKKIHNARVIVFGVGGVGSVVCEYLVRNGIRFIDLVDNDIVDITNLNRQLEATHRTVGKWKTEAMKERLLEISPNAEIRCHPVFFDESTVNEFDFLRYTYVVDAIDTVSSKIKLIQTVTTLDVPIISSMGFGNKLAPLSLRVSDIYDTRVCPLARVMRRELKKAGIKNLKTVWSEEQPVSFGGQKENARKIVPYSIGYMPATAGLVIVSEVLKDIMKG